MTTNDARMATVSGDPSAVADVMEALAGGGGDEKENEQRQTERKENEQRQTDEKENEQRQTDEKENEIERKESDEDRSEDGEDESRKAEDGEQRLGDDAERRHEVLLSCNYDSNVVAERVPILLLSPSVLQ